MDGSFSVRKKCGFLPLELDPSIIGIVRAFGSLVNQSKKHLSEYRKCILSGQRRC